VLGRGLLVRLQVMLGARLFDRAEALCC
jgi:hypothetical protein